ncbi:MAG: hypothetical protein EAZ65_03280 [Verrucomicrobia bacterium]|nr:MAG: hypothetical protein EAZ84_10050 [Verrucomicrobiota bacterium]TAE88400.1 MAG: hypothetical protein EAZ82_03965 [Verrucomicrobiota bacterium]TAF26854.1 MAG: hypothetical protein EAZ71_03275 [Verrucomicrobiota bacterium]TAF42112.1 MAG: hypothetical protein EAZ65_03280 [Verrucomicrobiota bacterium]
MRLLPLLVLSLAACAPTPQNWAASWSEHAAKDRIMLVRTTPETLGHRRLIHQSNAHPDLDQFLKRKGFPDFIAEASSEDRQYLILYYLDSSLAFSGRTRRSPGTRMDFDGPYPMTGHECSLLRELQRSSEAGSH